MVRSSGSPIAESPLKDRTRRIVTASAILKVHSLSLVVSVLSFIVFSMFRSEIYGLFLREIKFGGDVPVAVQFRNSNEISETIQGGLVIATQSSFVVRVKGTGELTEVFKDRVASISYLNELQELPDEPDRTRTGVNDR